MWTVEDKRSRFMESGVQVLTPGFYVPTYKYPHWWLTKNDVYFDRRISVIDSLTTKIIASIQKFWNAAKLYAEIGAVHKRGVFLYGPPGTGKSATVNELCLQVVDQGGIVLLAGQNDIADVEDLLFQVRTSDESMPIAVVMEDIETFIRNEKQQKAVLNLLSGQRQVSNVLYIATTNLSLKDISSICPALVNRPSRFDVVEFVGFPSVSTKSEFLAKFCPGLDAFTIHEIAKNTDGCSMAHIKEIVIGVYCLGEDLTSTINRVKKMKIDAPLDGEESTDEDDEDDEDPVFN